MNRREFIALVSAFGLDTGFARASSAVTRPEGEVRPKVVCCPKTGKFVMYFHLERKTDSANPGYRYGSARVGIAVNGADCLLT